MMLCKKQRISILMPMDVFIVVQKLIMARDNM